MGVLRRESLTKSLPHSFRLLRDWWKISRRNKRPLLASPEKCQTIVLRHLLLDLSARHAFRFDGKGEERGRGFFFTILLFSFWLFSRRWPGTVLAPGCETGLMLDPGRLNELLAFLSLMR